MDKFKFKKCEMNSFGKVKFNLDENNTVIW